MDVTSSVTQTCLPFRTLILVSKDIQILATLSSIIRHPAIRTLLFITILLVLLSVFRFSEGIIGRF